MENIKVKSVGRPKIEITEEFIEIWKRWRNGEFKSTVSAIRESRTSKSTFYRFDKILKKEFMEVNNK